MNEATAKRIVNRIVDDLNDRRGLGIDSVDSETQREIKKAWAKIIIAETKDRP